MNPLPEQIKQARLNAGLTQTAAAKIVHTSLNAWQKWEAGDRAMSAAAWELFTIKLERDKKMFILNIRGNDDRITEEENKVIDMILDRLDIDLNDMQDTQKVTGWESYSCLLNNQQIAHFERDFNTGYSSVAVLMDESSDDGKSLSEYLKSMNRYEVVPSKNRSAA